MGKVLFILLLEFFISSFAFAYTGKGFKILHESITSTPGFHFRVEEDVPQVKKNPKISARASANVPNREGRVSQYAQIDGHHHIDIYNGTQSIQRYQYTYTLDCEASHGSFSRHIELYSGGHFSTSDHSIGAVQKYYPGSFKILAATKVRGESDAYAADSGTLVIRK